MNNSDLHRLYKIKEEIRSLVNEAEQIIIREFPQQHSISISFWIPQIITALQNDPKWLSRGDHCMQEILTKIENDD